MKTKRLLALSAGIMLTSLISFAQGQEMINPYAIFGSTPYIAGDEQHTLEKVFVIDNFADSSKVGYMEHDPRTGLVRVFDKEGNLTAETQLEDGQKAWFTIDRYAEKYYPVSPYAYVANNPINRIDPDGREIVGVTKQDAQKFKADIYSVLINKKFDAARALIDLKGTTFKSIDADALTAALNGVTLNDDERTYVDMVTNTINSKNVHKIEYLTGATTSYEGATVFKDYMNSIQPGIGDAMVPNGLLNTNLVEGLGKEGFNVPTRKGSHSFISSSVQGNERASTSGHEVFGHGIPSAKKLSPKDNNANAIRTDNLIRRLQGTSQRDGKDHGGYNEGHITDPEKLPFTL